ncbi:unnamed protein product [Cuscuta europaea]|uniref:Transposase, Ptta/En/Spm, plant n=1 Tax=Cuscuta europaea TaxID=41803 RepID=A0A9P0ZH43_CUSEU|nr:unnamed protein product [Cuscuta europaea]
MSEQSPRSHSSPSGGGSNSRRPSSANLDINDDVNDDGGHAQTPLLQQSNAGGSTSHVRGGSSTSRAGPSRPAFAPQTEAERNNDAAFWVTPQSIHSDNEVLKRIKIIVGGHFTGDWATYMEVPAATRELWWSLFKSQHRWNQSQNEAILKAYNSRISAWMRPTFRNARTRGKKPGFLSDDVWENLVRHWSTDPIFLKRSQAGKENRNSEKAKELQWRGGRKPHDQHKKDLEGSGPVKMKVTKWALIKHCWTKGDESLPPRISEIEKKYEKEIEKKRAELSSSDDELDERQDDEAILAAVGVYKGRVPCLGAEGVRILHNSKGASSSSRPVDDERVARLEKKLAKGREEGRRIRERLEEMERQMDRFNTTYRPPMHIMHLEMTPQIPFMGGMGGSMGFPSYNQLPGPFSYGYYYQPFQTRGGQGDRGGNRGRRREDSRGGRRPEEPEEPEEPDDNDDS